MCLFSVSLASFTVKWQIQNAVKYANIMLRLFVFWSISNFVLSNMDFQPVKSMWIIHRLKKLQTKTLLIPWISEKKHEACIIESLSTCNMGLERLLSKGCTWCASVRNFNVKAGYGGLCLEAYHCGLRQKNLWTSLARQFRKLFHLKDKRGLTKRKKRTLHLYLFSGLHVSSLRMDGHMCTQTCTRAHTHTYIYTHAHALDVWKIYLYNQMRDAVENQTAQLSCFQGWPNERCGWESDYSITISLGFTLSASFLLNETC